MKKIMSVLRMSFFLTAIIALLSSRTDAAFEYYQGDMEIIKTSGKACTNLDVKKKNTLELALEKKQEFIWGYFIGEELATGRMSGQELTKLDVFYPYFDKSMAEGHKMTLSATDHTLMGELREKVLEPNGNGCNIELALFNLKIASTGADAEQTFKNMGKIFEGQLYFDEARMLYGKEDYITASTLLERALALREQASGRDDLSLLWYIDGLARSYGKSGQYKKAVDIIEEGQRRFRGEKERKTLTESMAWLWGIRGNDAYHKGAFGNAIEYYQNALALAPGDYNLTKNLALAEIEIKKLKEAGKEKGCINITGNKFSRLYHLPGMKYYNNVRSSRVIYFCTEDEAIKAGYKKAPR